MMSEKWLIDGYNLLHDLGGQKKNQNTVSRQNLFEMLASFSSLGDRRVTLVLDGKGNEDEFRPYLNKTFHIVYSQSVSADSYIERALYQNKGKFSFVVVTKDRAITNMARGSGARVIGADEFMELVKNTQKESKDILFKHEADAHGFNRPFLYKLKPLE